MLEDTEKEIKVIVVGNGTVGKTTMLKQFARGEQTDQYKKTVGTDFFEKEITTKGSGEEVKLLLWDTAGQEMFKALTQRYYKGAGAVVFAFATDNRQSFLDLGNWMKKVKEVCGDNIARVLVQNKIDLLEDAKVEPNEVEAFAKENKLRLYRTSALKNVLIDDVFDYLAEQALKAGDLGGAVASMGADGDAEESKSGATGRQEAKVVKLGPSKRRTGGKKKPCAII